MVNEEKVQLMLDLAIDEKKDDTQMILEGGYGKVDYIRSHVASVLWSITVCYLLVVLLIGLYHLEFLMINFSGIPYLRIAVFGGLLYVSSLVLGTMLSLNYYSKKYVQIKAQYQSYYEKLEKLNAFYQKKEEE